MFRRLLVVLVPLLAALFAALAVPLAANIAQGETQAVYLDRLADAERFAALADDLLRSGHGSTLQTEITRYDEVYGIAVAIYATDGRLLMVSRPTFDSRTQGIDRGLTAAFAGYRSEGTPTTWPWQRTSIVIVEPVGRDSGVIAAVVTVSPTDHLRSVVIRRWGQLAAFGAVLFVLALSGGRQLARWVLRPVRDLDRATVAIAAGRLDARAVTVTGPPELRRLATSFNMMIDTVSRTLSRQRTFVADASHQLRNPLASLRLAVENLADDVRPAGRQRHEVAMAEVADMGKVVDTLLSLTVIEGSAPSAQPQPVLEVVADRRARWRQLAEAAGMTLALDLAVTSVSSDLATHAPVDALGSILDELVGNACRLSGGTTVRVGVALRDVDVELSVLDDGMGLTAEELTRASDRFWRGPSHVDVSGTGLGLAICTEVVAAWGGRLTLHQARPQGLHVRILLPAVDGMTGQDLAERK